MNLRLLQTCAIRYSNFIGQQCSMYPYKTENTMTALTVENLHPETEVKIEWTKTYQKPHLS